MTASPTLRLRYLVAATAALTLAACGGGGSDSAAPAPAPAPTPAPTPAPAPTVAANCASLQNGTYRLIAPSTAQPVSTVTLTMDANGTPRLAFSDGTTDTLSAGSEKCAFTSASGTGSVVVGKGGLALASLSQASGGTRYPALLFPEQPTNASDLQGTWNMIAWERMGGGGSSQPFALNYGSVAFTTGLITQAQICPATSTGSCAPFTPPAGTGLTANPSGGFTGVGGLSGARGFVFRTDSDVLQVWLDGDGSLTLLAKQAALNLPTVGTVNTSWNLQADTAGALAVAGTDAVPGVSNSTNTITSVDAATGTFTRDASSAGAAPVSQTLHINTPLPGMRKRDSAANVSPVVMVRLTSDLTASSRLDAKAATTPGTGNGFLSLSLSKP